MTKSDLPAFGEADLSNCEREQIHLAGSIQPHGALLVLDDAAETILQASANAAALLHLDAAPLGRTLASLPGTLAARVKAQLGAPLHRRPVAIRARIGEPAVAVEALLHRPADGGLVVELEPAAMPLPVRAALDEAAQKILAASSLRALADETAALVKAATGYDRVMVYRFDSLGHGEVFSERREPQLEAFLGNRYPASDIPQIARRLYLETRVRLLVDVEYAPVPIVPRLSPEHGRELDMSLCALRSSSPVHVQYLKNMGVRATLVLSLVVDGKLWGLIACHHYAPKVVSLEMRGLCEIVAELVATRVAALESFVQTQSELVVRRLEQRMVEAIGRDGDWRAALFDGAGTLLHSLGAGGAALVYEGQVQTTGEVPATAWIRSLAGWLDGQPRETLSTTTLGRDAPEFEPIADVATGLVAVPISATAGEYLVWFRPERVRTVVWGGDPTKPVLVGNDPRQLSPRLSFAQWHERVEGTSDPWSRADLQVAGLIGATVADMVLQFRSVRLLIAQDQLDTLSRQVRGSMQPMIVAGPTGRLVIVNAAFEALLEPGHAALRLIEDLPALFTEPLTVRRHLDSLVAGGRPWRGEVALERGSGTPRPLALRAEAVHAAPESVLGYVLRFDEATDRLAADAARRHFHDGMMDRKLMRASGRLDAAGERDYREVLTAVVENAQLAALEITYGDAAEAMPRQLDALRASVTRTAELLEHLLWHAGEVDGGR